MSKEVKSKSSKKFNWTKAQLLGLYGIAIIALSFWSGVYLGQKALLNGQAQENAAKTQAVEEYKATLKAEQ